MPYKIFAQDTAAPFSHMVFYSLASLDKRADKLTGLKAKPPLQIVSNFKVTWCLEENNTKKIAENILKKLENQNYYEKILKNTYSSLKKFEVIALLYKKKNFSNLSNKTLKKLLKKYLDVWIETTIWGHIVNLSDFHFNLLSNKILELLTKAVKRRKVNILTQEAFSTLSTPLKETLLIKQENEFLSITAEIQAEKKVSNIFLKKDVKNIEKDLKIKYSEIFKQIKKHSIKYDWLQYHYLGPTILNIDYFIELISGAIKQNLKAKKKLREFSKNKVRLKKKQRDLIKRLNLGKKELYWFKVAQEFIYLKALRKEITFIACRSMDSLLKEISKKLNISLRQLQVMTPKEIFKALLENKKISDALLNKRIRYCVVYYPKRRAKIYIGKKATNLAKKIIYEKVSKKLKEIKGMVAYPGKAKGVVRVILEAKEMKKMKKGDILISPATNPNIMLAIKKAAAIVTDEGGITSHAAIVSRELKIPCIIGTKIATKLLKDGDLVEVDATKGLFKIIK